MPNEETTVSREVLFEQVWAKPMSKLAQEYGISDVGLAKICKRMEIPRPARGYWQKLAIGRALPQPKLKPLTAKGVSQVTINPTPPESLPSKQATDIEEVPCPDTLTEPHRLTQKSISALEKGKPGDRGIVYPRNKICHDIHVTKSSIHRACLIMDTLVKALEKRNYSVNVIGDRPIKTIVTIEGVNLEIGIDEKTRQVDHIPTPEEKKRNAGYSYWHPRYDFLPTDLLVLKIRNTAYLRVRLQWSDGKVQRIENCLGSIVAGLRNAAHAEKQWRIDKELQELRWAENERRRAELERLARIEDKKAEKLTLDVSNWVQANQIRDYINQIGNIKQEVEGLVEWTEWAKAYADKLDPLQQPNDLTFKMSKSTNFI